MAEPSRGLSGILVNPVLLQRFEGGVMLVLALLFYWKVSGNWLLFVLLILAPDLFALGYLGGNRLGAATYNLSHTWLFPGILAAAAILGGGTHLVTELALIWFGHIGGDRLFGFGLKLPTAFQDTHLGRIGKRV
jgi:Domain of unknown function (DUF4260)